MFIVFDRNNVSSFAVNIYTAALPLSYPQKLCLHAAFSPQNCVNAAFGEMSVSTRATLSSATHLQSLEYRIHSFSTCMHFQLRASFNARVVMTTMSVALDAIRI